MLALVDELIEGVEIIGLGGVGVAVVVADGGDDGEVGVVIEEVAVEFVAFVDEEAGVFEELAAGGEAEGGADEVAGGDLELAESPD